MGVGRRGGRAGTGLFSPRSQTKPWEGLGRAHCTRKLKI